MGLRDELAASGRPAGTAQILDGLFDTVRRLSADRLATEHADHQIDRDACVPGELNYSGHAKQRK
jgi:hypothetical protein